MCLLALPIDEEVVKVFRASGKNHVPTSHDIIASCTKGTNRQFSFIAAIKKVELNLTTGNRFSAWQEYTLQDTIKFLLIYSALSSSFLEIRTYTAADIEEAELADQEVV